MNRSGYCASVWCQMSADKVIILAEAATECEGHMINVTRMNGTELTINAELIETIEEVPDTVIALTTGKKFIVKESRQKVVNLVKLYKNEIICGNSTVISE